MEYPEEFKQKVLSTLVDTEAMRKMLDLGYETVGRIIFDSGSYINPEEVVDAYESGNMQDLYEKAKRLKNINRLYSEWSELYRSQHSKTNK